MSMLWWIWYIILLSYIWMCETCACVCVGMLSTKFRKSTWNLTPQKFVPFMHIHTAQIFELNLYIASSSSSSTKKIYASLYSANVRWKFRKKKKTSHKLRTIVNVFYLVYFYLWLLSNFMQVSNVVAMYVEANANNCQFRLMVCAVYAMKSNGGTDSVWLPLSSVPYEYYACIHSLSFFVLPLAFSLILSAKWQNSSSQSIQVNELRMDLCVFYSITHSLHDVPVLAIINIFYSFFSSASWNVNSFFT